MITSQFGFTNVTPHTKTIAPVQLGIVTNYGLTVDEPTQATYTNLTCPVDQGELISYKRSKVLKVSSSLENLYPPKVATGVQYVVKLETMAALTSGVDSEYHENLPIVAYLTIRHPQSANLSDAQIGTIVQRLMGATIRTDGTFRFNDLVRGALKPKAD